MQRFRRLRANPAMRRMVRETRIDPAELIYPIFVAEGENIKTPVDSMPTVYQYSIDRLEEILPQIAGSGISGLLIFARGTEAYNDEGITQRAIRYIKAHYPDMIVIADVCLCEYTDHGHCGLVCGCRILNDETLPLLSAMSVSLAKAGADIIAPSDMEALREIEDDIREGADMVMVKPALAYLDVLKSARERFDLPLVAYNVSGEFSMVKAAAQMGWIDERRIVMENLTAIKRAGADIIITYHALDAAAWIKEEA